MRTSFLIFFIFLNYQLKASNIPLYFKYKKYTVENGLPDNWVKEMVFDQKGFLWMATLNGISKFDSYQFHNFNLNTNIKLKWKEYHSIIYHKNEVWASSDSGIAIINTQNYKVRYLKIDINYGKVHKIYKADNNNIYYFQSNGYLSKVFDNELIKTVLVHKNWFKNMVDDGFGRLFIGYLSGRVDVLNSSTLDIINTFNFSQKTNEGTLLYKDKNNIVSFQSDSFLYSFNPSIGRFEKNITSILFKINAISYKNGYYYYTKNFKTIYKSNINLTQTYENVLNLKNAYISQLIISPNNAILLATNQGIVVLSEIDYVPFVLKDLPSTMKEIKVRRAILKKNDNELYLLNYDGIEIYNLNTDSSYYVDNKSKSINSYFGKIEDNFIWLGLDGRGIDRYDLISKRFMNENEIIDSTLRCVFHFVDFIDNKFLLATNQGLMTYNKKNDKFEAFKDARLKVFMRNIAIGPNKQYYISTNDGLLVLDSNLNFVYKNALITQQELGKMSVSKLSSVVFDNHYKNIAWISTSYGLIKYDCSQKKIIHHQTFGSSIASNIITGIEKDKFNRLWLSSYNGIICYQSENHFSYIVKVKDMPFNTNELYNDEYNYNSHIAVDDSTLIFGGLTHYIKINPYKVKVNKRVDQLYFTSIDYQYSKSNHYNYYLHSQSIQLKSKNDFVRVYVAINSYVNPNLYSYFYKLNNSELWTSLGNKPLLEIYNLTEGINYVEIKAINELGVEAANRLFLTIKVPTVFYKSIYFYIALLLLLLAISIIIFYIRANNLKQILALKSQISLDLHDEVGSILTGTSIQAELLKRQYPQEPGLILIEKNLRYAIRSMKDMVWSMNQSLVLLSQFVDRVNEVSQQIIINDTIDFDFQYQLENPQLILSTLQKRNLLLIIKEALNNVVKHSNASKCIVRMKEIDGLITIEIEDNGIGIDMHETNSGIGLTSLNKRALDINGSIFFKTSNEGTIITITIKI